MAVAFRLKNNCLQFKTAFRTVIRPGLEMRAFAFPLRWRLLRSSQNHAWHGKCRSSGFWQAALPGSGSFSARNRYCKCRGNTQGRIRFDRLLRTRSTCGLGASRLVGGFRSTNSSNLPVLLATRNRHYRRQEIRVVELRLPSNGPSLHFRRRSSRFGLSRLPLDGVFLSFDVRSSEGSMLVAWAPDQVWPQCAGHQRGVFVRFQHVLLGKRLTVRIIA